MYTFVLASLDKCPNLKQWMLVITPEDNMIGSTGIPKNDSVLQTANDKAIDSYARRYFSDPHMNIEKALARTDSDGKDTNVFFSVVCHPLVLDGQKREAMAKFLSQGRTIFINRNGGYSFAEGYTVLEQRVLDTMMFPPADEVVERITVSRYPGCKHYYLSSNMIGRIFAENQFWKKQTAVDAAKQYVDEDHITVKEDSFAYMQNGD